jgi:hypothetical protein
MPKGGRVACFVDHNKKQLQKAKAITQKVTEKSTQLVTH